MMIALRPLRGLAAAFALLVWPAPASAEEVAVDLELVLAVDVSLSMDTGEQRMQMDGYVAAFRHPEVIAAILSGQYRRIAVTFLQWGGVGYQTTLVPWTLIDGEESAHAFAERLDGQGLTALPRTSISDAITFSATLFEGNGYTGLRRVIDVSGDGPNNMGIPVNEARDAVTAMGITINGLPVMLRPGQPPGYFDLKNLDVYYEDCVIGGAGAFIVRVRDMANFARAVRRKLILEMAGPAPRLTPAQFAFRKAPRIDCLIGEKMWEEWLSHTGE